tara:strand:+ start:6257 stop:8014 length:1758 start_codon:yes stop_codon:yes gene_type:complete
LFFQKNQNSTLYKLFEKSDSLFKAKKYTRALKLALRVIDDAEKSEDLELISKTNYLIGRIWYLTESYENAIFYFKTSLKQLTEITEVNDSSKELDLEKLNNNYNVLNNNLQIGSSYLKLFNSTYEVGLDRDSLKNKIYRDSIIFYYGKIVNASSLSRDISLLKSKALNNLAGVYIRDSIYDLAKMYTLKSLEIKKKIGDQYSIAAGYNALFNIHFSNREYEKGKEALFKGVETLDKIKGEKADKIRVALYLNLAYSMYKLEDYHAYEYQKRSWELYDNLKDRDNEQKLADIYADRNFDKGLKEGILQEEIKRQKAQKTTWIIGITSFFVIILLVFVLNQYKLRQKNLGLELSKKDLLQQQKLEKVRSESQIRILNATLDGKETERKEIAETLHDSVSALLSSANLHLQACKKQFNGATPIEVDKSQKIINEASQKIRDLSHTLVSSILLKFGLGYAIKDMVEKYSNSQLQIAHETKYIKRYDQGFEIKLYNITQEFINNILKHSNATHASITLIEKNKKLRLVIKDNGDGFDTALIPEKDGLGINQIEARIQMMEGEFTIETSNGKGTHIHIELPVCERVLTKFA